MVSSEIIVAMVAIGVAGSLCQWLSWRLRVPAILFLLLAGIALGPVTGWLRPDELFGPLLFPFVSLAVAVVLFEGSLTLRLEEIAGLESVVRRLVTGGLLVTWIVVAFSAHWLAGFSWELAALLGAILVVTGPTVIVPMLRTVRPTARIANILRWEGIVIDPVGALLAVLVFDFIVSAEGSSAFGQTIVAFFKLVGVGISIGLAAGFGLGEAMRRDWLPGYLDNMVTLAVVFAAFAVANGLAAESGLLAVTTMGIYLANRRGISLDTIIEFKESLSLLLISGLFIVLAARLDLAKLRPIAAEALAVLVVVQFVARPLKVWLSTFGSTLSWRERVVLGWISPRGIVAAAVCALFALQLERLGFQQAELMVPVVFTVILGTVALPSLTARLLARSLKVAEPDADGFLIVGAGRVALAIAKALTEREQIVVMADQDWFNVQRARSEGLRVYHGNPLSEHAETHLDLAGVGRLLALSADPHLNALACARFRSEFGARRVYAARAEEGGGSRVTTMPATQIAFGEGVSLEMLDRLLAAGGEVRVVPLADDFTYKQYREAYGSQAISLFAGDQKGRVEVVTAASEPEPPPGGSVIAALESGARKLVAAPELVAEK